MADTPVKDRRVRKTQGRLREALVALIHEKSYPAIVVRDILERADVGRSAFYAHFRNKDALLASGIEQLLLATGPRPIAPTLGHLDKALWFSFPVFDYVGRCRHTAGAKMGKKGRIIVHQHLRRVLIEQIGDDVKAAMQRSHKRTRTIPTDLLIDYIVTTFILVLNWWVETKSPLSPQEVDDLFLALVAPAMSSSIDRTEMASPR